MPDLEQPTPSSPVATPPPAPPRRSRASWPLRALLRLLRLLLVIISGLLIGVVCFALFPPADLLRRAGVVIGRSVLNHPRLDLAGLELSPLRGLELRGLWLGPPAGYRWPLFTLKRVEARWDLRRIGEGELRLRSLLVERPLLRVEQRGGKLGWQAFLDGLPPSEPKPEKKSEPSSLRIWIDRVAVVGVGALVDDGKQRLLLDGLQVGLAGLYSQARTRLDLSVRLRQRRPGRPNLALLLPGAPGQARLGGRFLLQLGLEVALEANDGLDKPRAELELRTGLGSKEIRAPWALQPINLELGVQAGANLQTQRAELKELRLQLDQTELLRLRAGLEGLPDPRTVRLDLDKLLLPLDQLAPYLRAVLPGLEVGGSLAVRELHLSGPIKELKEKKLPALRGLIEVSKLRARYRGERANQSGELRDLDLLLSLASRGEAERETAPGPMARSLPGLEAAPDAPISGRGPALLTRARLRLGSARGAGAELRGLELRLAAGLDLDGVKPAAFASRLSLGLASARYQDAKLGALQTSLQTQLRAEGNLGTGQVRVERLDLSLGNWLRTHLSAALQGFGRQHLRAELEVEPFRIERALQQLPPPLRASLGKLRLTGSLGLRARVSGRTPAPGTPPLRLPVELDTRLSLADLDLADPERQLFVEKLGGQLRLHGKPSDLHFEQDLRLRSLRKPDQHLSLVDLQLPASAHILPSGIEARLAVKLARVSHQGAGFSGQDSGLDLELKAALPLERAIAGQGFAPGATRLRLGLRSAAARLAKPGNTLNLRGLSGQVELGYQPQQQELTVASIKLQAASVRQAEQGAVLDQVSVGLRTGLWGPRLQVPLAFTPDQLTPRGLLGLLQRVETGLEVKIGRFALRGVFDQALRDNQLQLQAAIGADERLRLRRLTLRVPGRGLQVELSGQVGELLSVAPSGPLPPFDLRARLNLDNRVTHDSRKALLISPDLKVAGKVGVDLRVRRLGQDRIQLDGTLLARRFNLWLRSVGVEEQAENLLSRTRLVHLKDMDAEVPISQQLIVRLPELRLPPPRRSIFEGGAASALYSAMQPYTGSRSRLRIGGLTIDERLTVTTRQGYFLSTVNRRIPIDRIALDLGIADSTLQLSRLYLKLFGGDVAGEVQAQVMSLNPFDVRLRLRTQVTGVNLAYLDLAAKERTAKTEVSALVDMKYWLSRQFVEGRVDITRLSLDMLDALLAYLDPNKTNESVQNNRKLINAWYTKWINPKVKLVAVWISHGNLNMDIDMDAWFVAGTIIKRTLKNMRIRRINIVPFLPRGAGAVEE